MESPIAPLWIRLLELPYCLFRKEALVEIASTIQLLNPSNSTTTQNPKANPAFTRVCVEMDVTAERPNGISIQMSDITIEQKVIYENIPRYCNNCKHIGHDIKGCKWIKQEATIPNVKNMEKNQTTQNKEIQKSNINIPDSNGAGALQNDKHLDDRNISHQTLEIKGIPLKPQAENKAPDNHSFSTHAKMDLIMGSVSRDIRYRRNRNSRSKKKDNVLMGSHSDEDNRALTLKEVDIQNGDGDGALTPLNHSHQSVPLIGIQNKFEVLYQLNNITNPALIREEVLSEPDLRDSESEADHHPHNALLNDGKVQALSSQSKDDCLPINGRYPRIIPLRIMIKVLS